MALKVGAEDKKKLAAAVVLGAVALFFVGRMLIDTFSPAPIPAAAPPTPAPASVRAGAPAGSSSQVVRPLAAAAVPAVGTAQKLPGAGDIDPTLHPEKMEMAETIEYKGTGRNIFSKESAPVQPIETVKAPIRPPVATQVASGPVGPAPPPPIDLKFFGVASQQSGRRRVFLLHGEDVFVAAEGDVVDRRYRVIQISPNSVVIEDIPYSNRQSLPLSAA